jgi:hypothetical protein
LLSLSRVKSKLLVITQRRAKTAKPQCSRKEEHTNSIEKI